MSLVETVVTYLEMRGPPDGPPLEPPRDDLVVTRAHRPTVSFYRWLYETVGAPWLWTDRRRLGDGELRGILDDDEVEVHVLYAGGVPAGYVELDRRVPPQAPGEIELAYLGLLPEFIGRGLGPFLLDFAIRRAWSQSPSRFWVHTQTLDHPKALGLYRRLGFVPYREETIAIDLRLT